MEINILSWNIGETTFSFDTLSELLSPRSPDSDSSAPDFDAATPIRDTAGRAAFRALSELPYKPDLLCLQDIKKVDLDNWTSDFWTFHTAEPFAIGYNPTRFEEIPTHETAHPTHFWIQLKEKESGKILRVATAALPPLAYDETDEENNQRALDAALDLDSALATEDSRHFPNGGQAHKVELCLAGLNTHRENNKSEVGQLHQWGYEVLADQVSGGRRDVQAILARSDRERKITLLGQCIIPLIPYDSPALNPSLHSPLLVTVTCHHEPGILRKTYDTAATVSSMAWNCTVQ